MATHVIRVPTYFLPWSWFVLINLSSGWIYLWATTVQASPIELQLYIIVNKDAAFDCRKDVMSPAGKLWTGRRLCGLWLHQVDRFTWIGGKFISRKPAGWLAGWIDSSWCWKAHPCKSDDTLYADFLLHPGHLIFLKPPLSSINVLLSHAQQVQRITIFL